MQSKFTLTSRNNCVHQAVKLAVEKTCMSYKPFTFAQAAFAEAPGAPRKRVVAIAKVSKNFRPHDYNTHCLLKFNAYYFD